MCQFQTYTAFRAEVRHLAAVRSRIMRRRWTLAQKLTTLNSQGYYSERTGWNHRRRARRDTLAAEVAQLEQQGADLLSQIWTLRIAHGYFSYRYSQEQMKGSVV